MFTRRKKIFSAFLAFMTIALFTLPSVISAETPKITPTKIEVRPLRLTDLELNFIEAWACPCQTELASVNVIFPQHIFVRVWNKGSIAVSAEVTVTFKSLQTGAMVTHTLNIANLTANSIQSVMVPGSKFLISKSIGITATVKITTAGVTDPNSANNSQTIKICQVWIG